MLLDLHQIIEVSGGQVPFECQLDSDRLWFPALAHFDGAINASGTVKNTAGILELTAVVEADMTVRCDRCAVEFAEHLSVPVEATLKADAEEGEYADLFPLEGDSVDISDVLETCLILNTELKFLCRKDCKGLCPTCGKNLNENKCSCNKQLDPRMAVLGQLLDDIQEV